MECLTQPAVRIPVPGNAGLWVHSSFCSASTAPTERMTHWREGKIPTALARRRFPCSASELLLRILCRDPPLSSGLQRPATTYCGTRRKRPAGPHFRSVRAVFADGSRSRVRTRVGEADCLHPPACTSEQPLTCINALRRRPQRRRRPLCTHPQAPAAGTRAQPCTLPLQPADLPKPTDTPLPGRDRTRIGGSCQYTGSSTRHPVRLGNTIRGGACGQSGSDVVLVGESAENLSAVDPVLGEVDRLWWLSLGLSWCELAEGAVRAGQRYSAAGIRSAPVAGGAH